MQPLEIRNATPSEIRTAISEAHDKVRLIGHLAWVADVVLMDKFKGAGDNERLCEALWALFNITESLAQQADTTLMECL